MDYESLIGTRVVLRCNNNMTFAGTFVSMMNGNGREYIWVETDQKSGFSILCPVEFVEELVHIPITPV
jgi:hypothetical protein